MKIERLPAWSLLSRTSLDALLASQGGAAPETIAIQPSVTDIDVGTVPLLATTRLLIERAQVCGGLTLTATGALSRADTRAIFDVMSWPGYDKAHVLVMNKVLNEADVMPVEATRLIAQTAKLLRRRDLRLLATKKAQALLAEGQTADLFRLLFEIVFWRINLGYFDRVPVEQWPQNHIGIVLWCLSVAAQDWSTPAEMVPVCTVPDEALEDGPADFPGFAFLSRVLQPLTWFGLMELRLIGEESQPEWRRERQYRKTTLYDRVLHFDVEVMRPRGFSH
ncbi:hypothetical protein [Methylobacterium soli]|uniref:Uncharacterized protein n=1 Tax=Methylobacterium soli TaxID=553447 RepID=A0A6L3SW61_9HYPH|nr:hypothetical protein [Methylobacterium soli]KAB1077159.1 hypothetical protein F6X53_19955 [Methylobacterium soli]